MMSVFHSGENYPLSKICPAESQHQSSRKDCDPRGLFPHGNTAYTIFSVKVLYIASPNCLNGRLSCVNFVDVIMGDIPARDPLRLTALYRTAVVTGDPEP